MVTRPALSHTTAIELLQVELGHTLELLRSLNADDWQAPTDCPGWDIRTMYLHVLGACEAGASMSENIRQMRAGRRYQRANGGPLEAALSATQIQARADLSPGALIDRLASIAPRTVRRRARLPAPIRRLSLKVDGPVVEKWSLGYLSDVIYLRDLWMHRVDASRAANRAFAGDAAHDGVIIADVVAEWFRRHGQGATLQLTGPAGGEFAQGGEVIELDAVEYCRTLAGRAPATHPLLATIVPF